MARRRDAYVSVDVRIDDILSDIPDEALREICDERFGYNAPDFQLLVDIEEELLRGHVAAALALIENQRTLRRVPDQIRAKQLASMRTAGAA